MARQWFDPESGFLKLDEYVADVPSFKKIMADDIVTDEEVTKHSEQVVTLLKELDTTLPDDIKEKVMEALCQLSVLYAIQRVYERQSPTES
jgi:hypothetical protein